MRFASPLLGYAFGTSLFHTLDGRRTWQQEPSTAPILSLAYAGYASSDGGATWQTRSDPCLQTGFAQGAATAPVGHLFTVCEFVASGINLVRSDDGGRSVSAAITAPIGYEFAAGSGTTLAEAAWDGNVPVVKTSFDGGAHWQTTLTCPVGRYPFYQVLALGY